MMVSGSGVRQVPRFLLCGFGGIRRAVFEAEAVVSGFEDVAAVGKTIEQRGRHLGVAEHGEGIAPHEIGLFVRTPKLVTRARAAIGGLAGESEMTTAPMSLAKGLEFRAVVVMACDEGILPLDERVADAADEAELDDIYETERRLLYVACTRAREHLLLTGVSPTSEYLDDFEH
jgi:superfamily I DNA/RNA helicase